MILSVCLDYHKISRMCITHQQESPLPCRWILWSEKQLQQKCARCRQRAAGRASQIDKATAQVSTRAIDNFHTAVYIGISIQRLILVGLLKAYPCVGAIARSEDRIEVRRRDELKISRGPMRLLRVSPPTKICCPAFYNVPSLRRTSCVMHKNNRQLNFMKIFKEKYRCECEYWTFTHAMHCLIGFWNMLAWLYMYFFNYYFIL